MLTEEMQEILAVPDPDLNKFNPDNAVRRSVRAAKTPKLLVTESIIPPPPRKSHVTKSPENVSNAAAMPPARKKQKRQQPSKGLQSPPVTPASKTVYNSREERLGVQSTQDYDGDIEMINKDGPDSDAEDEFVPASKKRARAKAPRGGPRKPAAVPTAAEANMEMTMPNVALVATSGAPIESSMRSGLRKRTGAASLQPGQISTNGIVSEDTLSAQHDVPITIGVQAVNLSNGGSAISEHRKLDPKLSVAIGSSLFGTERPDSQGEPIVWAEGRQALCESLPYFRGYQTAGYAYGGQIYGFLLDKECHGRDYMDATVVITRAGGGLSRDKASGTMVQNQDQSESAQVRAMRNNIERHVPIVLIVGKGNPKCPSVIPHTYCVMGWFKPTHIWSEMDGSKKLFKYRLEKMDMHEPSWWAPRAPEDMTSMANPQTIDQSATHTPLVDDLVTGTPANLNSLISYTSATSIPAANHECCQGCQHVSPQVYFEGWMCLNGLCDYFWKLEGQRKLEDLTFDLRFLRHQTPWPAIKEPYGVKPDPVSIEGQHKFGFDVSYAAWKGFVCPRCGRCNSRQDWQGWKCLNEKCSFVHNMPHTAIPAQALSDPNQPLTDGHAIPRDTAAFPITTQVEFFNQYRVHTYTIPDCGTVVHFMANKVINGEPNGPDEMWQDVQSADVGLKRFELKNAMLKGPMLTQHFAINYGMPYKYAVAVQSESFDDCCQAIRSARSRLNWAGRYVAGSSRQHKEFNELLALGYFEKQEIDFHDDGEYGLGPTIATLSLGYPATMKIRMKAKHYSGVSKGGAYLHADPPVPGSLHYAARLDAYMAMDGIEGSNARKTRGQAIKGALGLKSQKCPNLLSMHLNHGDIVVMHGEKHAVQPIGQLRFALTCRYIDPNSLAKSDVPKYAVETDDGFYDGEHPVIMNIPTPPSTAGNGEGLPEANDLPTLEASNK
ncbi:MAG: hypothetical protein M1835_005958 [Candelina submexicana]|nr:MAG: hypothetical protein M1835_005958 [Candelina submexicana]